MEPIGDPSLTLQAEGCIQLPFGTDRRGLHLAPPHGELIYDRRKTAIAKARPFDLSGPWILLSGGMAYGTLDVGRPQPVSVEEFDQRFSEHRVTQKERQRWWPNMEPLYLSRITYFEPFEQPYPVNVYPGMQTVVEQVEFKEQPPADLDDHCEVVRMVLESIDPKAQAGATVVAPHAAKAEGAAEEDTMPYDVENPPEKLRNMPEKAQRLWVHAFNSCMEDRDDEGRCHQIAYGAVKRAGYYQDDEGAWHAKEQADDAEAKQGSERVCVCPECGSEGEHEVGVPCSETACPQCDSVMYGRSPTEAKSKGAISWLRDRFENILGDMRALVANPEPPVEQEQAPFVGFKTLEAKDGKPWLLTWTTNAFMDRDEEIFTTKAIEDYVERHEADGKKGEYWFWHLPGAKFGDIVWQAVVGRFLVEMGPFDDTELGRKMADFFSQHPRDHPEIAPDGWGTSHGYWYQVRDRQDATYEWFDKFETTVLPLVAASNPYTLMEVMAMNDAQKTALETIGSELGVENLVEMVSMTGEERTKELEEQGVRFKTVDATDPPQEAAQPDAEVKEAEPDEPAVEVVPVEAAAEKTEDEVVLAPEEPAPEDSGAKAIAALAQQIMEGMGVDNLMATIAQVQVSVDAVAEAQKTLTERLDKLEDIGATELSPLIPLPRGAYFRAATMGAEPSEKQVTSAAPRIPDAIVEMAKRIPF